MNGTTALIILNIAIIGIIAIIIVKLYYRDESKDKDIKSLRDLKPDFLEKRQVSKSNTKPSLSREPVERSNSAFITDDGNDINKVVVTPDEGVYKVEKVVLNNAPAKKTTSPEIKVEYPTENEDGSISINKDIEEETIIPIKEEEIKKEIPRVSVPKESTEVKHTVERITPKIRTIKTPETSTSELKDLFTIDELIKESKRKDNERNKKHKGEDREESIIKDSISKNKAFEVRETASETEKPSLEEIPEPELKTPVRKEALKAPTPKDTVKDDVSVINLKEDSASGEEEYLELDYRKDLNKIKNVFKKSKVIKNVKDKIAAEPVITDYDANDEFIRNVEEYKEEPIISRHPSVNKEEKTPLSNEKIREENTRKVFNMAKNTAGEVKTEKKEISSRNSINMVLNNSNVTLKKNDEIIFLRNGDSYSSKVFDIKGEDIYVKYRGKMVSIRTSDIKKIY